MFKQALSLAAVLALAACSGSSNNPITSSATTAGEAPVEATDNAAGVPVDIANNVTDVVYDDDADSLIISGLPFVGSPTGDGTVGVELSRNTQLEAGVDGYQVYSRQDDRLQRIYVAVSAQSADGSVRATSVADGGRLGVFYSGNHYERYEDLTRPENIDTNTVIDYAGTYAGVTNLDALGQPIRIPPNPDTDVGELLPAQPRQTVADVHMKVDFTTNSVEGSIYNRQFVDGEALDSLDLNGGGGNLDEGGEFNGTVTFVRQNAEDSEVSAGAYAGILGGEDAAGMAGVVELENVFRPTDVRAAGDQQEMGTFVIPRCGTATAPDICDGL